MKHSCFAIADSRKNPRFVGSTTPAHAAHAALDRAVDRAYAVASGIKTSDPFSTDRARVEHLFALYERLTAPLLPAAKVKRLRKATP